MMSREEAQKIKNLKNEKSCKNCMKLGVCWLVASVSGALAQHAEKSSVLMFEYEKMALICTQYISSGEQIEITNLM